MQNTELQAVAVSKEEQLEHELAAIWRDCVTSVNHVLEADKFLGFAKFELAVNPSVEEIGHAIAIIDEALKSLLEHADKMSYDAYRHLANAQQSSFLIRRIFLALKRKDDAEYDDCINKLKSQRKY